MSEPPLKLLHSEKNIIQLKLDEFGNLPTDVLLDSLLPGKDGALKVRPDGTVLDGHHRLIILHNRGINIDELPREIIEKDSSAV
jgi:hypothetical protein